MKVNQIICGDCLEVMQGFPDNCIDSIVTDPPYGWSFMGKQWDYDIPAVEVWQEALRVLKPGGHALIACGTRTQHRMAVNIEDAGFEIRDLIMWHYGSGFPKSHAIGKAVDKLLGNERELVGEKKTPDGKPMSARTPKSKDDYHPSHNVMSGATKHNIWETKGTSKHEGWGTALKPATEIITLARKPLSEKTIAENVLRWGTGGINIDGCRVEHNEECKLMKAQTNDEIMTGGGKYGQAGRRVDVLELKPQGRFPSNVILDGSTEVKDCFPDTKSGGINPAKHNHKNKKGNALSGSKDGSLNNYLPHQVYKSDSGSAARFFYTAKASRRERSKANNHPTVKPIKLMKYLVKLITPSKGICLDLYAGSGSTVFACIEEGFNFVAIEISEEYCKIANQRINNAQLSLF